MVSRLVRFTDDSGQDFTFQSANFVKMEGVDNNVLVTFSAGGDQPETTKRVTNQTYNQVQAAIDASLNQ